MNHPFEAQRAFLKDWMRRVLLRTKQLATPPQQRTPAALFVDNRFPRCCEQLEVFFANRLLDPKRTTLVYRRYASNHRALESFAARWQMHTLAFRSGRSLASLQHQVVFYPFNGMLNLRLLKNNSMAHVFLTHGESSKAATVHRMVRLYDLVLAPGRLAIDRYIEFGVLSAAEASERVICVGTALTASLSFPGSCAQGDAPPALLYLPTWEGGIESECYTSVGHEATERVLRGLARRLGIRHILIKPHPNLGTRVFTLPERLRQLASALRAAGLVVHFLETGSAATVDERMGGAPVFAAVDVSAAEAMAAARGLPSVVLMRQGFPVYAPASYLRCRRRAMILLDDSTSVSEGLNYVGSPAELHARREFRKLLFSDTSELDASASSDDPFSELLQLAIARTQAHKARPIIPGLDTLHPQRHLNEVPRQPCRLTQSQGSRASPTEAHPFPTSGGANA